MTTHEPNQRDKETVLKIFRALSDYIAEGGKQANTTKVAREALFFIYEGGTSGKYDRPKKSKKADQLLRTGKLRTVKAKGECLRYDHAIPLKCWLYPLVQECKKLQCERILAKIKLHDHIRIITKGENEKLNEKGFREKMPPGWDEDKPKNISRKDWIKKWIDERYQAAGIEF